MIDLEKLKALWQQGLPVKEIAAVLGCSDSCASKYAMRLGFPRRRPGSYKVPVRLCLQLYDEGVGSTSLAKRFGVCVGTIIRVLRLHKRDVRNRTVLDDPRTALCVRLRRKGMTCPDIAKVLNMRRDAVSKRTLVVFRGKKNTKELYRAD